MKEKLKNIDNAHEKKPINNAIISLSVLLVLLVVATVICFVSPAAANAQEDQVTILSMLNDYGNTESITGAVMERAALGPVMADCGDVHISITEMLYDGIWMYTAAKIQATDPNKVLIMPGAAEVSDPVGGVNGEIINGEKRSYLEVARAEGKKLLAVYVYPKEFDGLGEYLLDYRQLADNCTAFFSSAAVEAGNEPTTLTWSVQVYEVDLDTTGYTLQTMMESEPQTVFPLEEISYQKYLLENDAETLCDEILLAKSAVTTYMLPQWTNEDDKYFNYLTMLTEEGKAVEHGIGPDMRAVSISDFPESFLIEINGDDQEQLRFVKVD